MKNFTNIIFIISIIVLFTERMYFNSPFVFGIAIGVAAGAYRYMNHYSKNSHSAMEEYKKVAIKLREINQELELRGIR